MKKQIKTVVYDEQLRLEAFRFEDIGQPFSNHFHEYYVIGLVEKGKRRLFCKNQEFDIGQGDIILFNPGDNHSCTQTDGGLLDYRSFNISKEVMLDLVREITGTQGLPGFSQTVVRDREAACALLSLHQLVMEGSPEFGKEELLLFTLSLLLQRWGQPFPECIPDCSQEIEKVCAFMEEHYMERISLEQLCRHGGLSKSTLLRAFTRAKRVTPYCYLENIRIGAAKKMLEQGMAPMEAALLTGFSDQSHFTNYFSRFIGLTPGSYREIFIKNNEGEENQHDQ